MLNAPYSSTLTRFTYPAVVACFARAFGNNSDHLQMADQIPGSAKNTNCCIFRPAFGSEIRILQAKSIKIKIKIPISTVKLVKIESEIDFETKQN